MRACRYPHRMRTWKQLPSGLFVSVQDPGVCVGAPLKEVRLAETQTVLKGEEAEQAIRTIICREVRPGPKKDRWHPLYTTSAADELEAHEVLSVYRARQNHEQGHRVEVHDLLVDAVPCGYDKESPDRMRPRFHRGQAEEGVVAAVIVGAVVRAAAVERGHPDVPLRADDLVYVRTERVAREAVQILDRAALRQICAAGVEARPAIAPRQVDAVLGKCRMRLLV